MKGLNWIYGKTRRWTDLRLSSAQFWLSSPTDSSFTPESFRLLLPRSSPLRWEGLDFRAEATTSQWVSESPQPESLSWDRHYTNVLMKEENLYLLHAFDVKTFCSVRCLAQWVERTSHVPRLCSGPGFDSQPGSLCCLSLPLSLAPCFLSYLQLFYQKRPKKQKINTFWLTFFIYISGSANLHLICDTKSVLS